MVWECLELQCASYWSLNHFLNENFKIWNWKLYWNLKAFSVLLESPQQLRFNQVYFTIFRAKVWKILIFECILFSKISNKLQKLGLAGKTSWALNVLTLLNFEIFNFEILKNEKYVHACANWASYTSIENNGLFEVQWCQLHERYHHNWSFPNILCQHREDIMGVITKPGEYGWASC